MTEGSADPGEGIEAPTAVKKSARERGFSPIWIIPIVALFIGVFLIYRVLSEQGPTITISFEEASGLAAGKTKVKFRDVDVGEVKAITLDRDMKGVTLTVDMLKGAEGYLTENTRFWAVRARITAGNVSGLGTLLSGDYIAIDPSSEGAPATAFTGLEQPPVIQSDDVGTRFKLRSETLGGLDFGSPVYFKRMKVGRVVDYKTREDGDISLEIFVKEPYDKQVTDSTRFWNASGVDVEIGADGVTVDTQSLMSILVGGIAFRSTDNFGPGEPEPAAAHQEFRLYANRAASRLQKYHIKHQLVLYFEDSVRGLLPGAPVELRGYKIGQVLDVAFEFNRDSGKIRMPVMIQLEPERITTTGKEPDFEATMNELVDKGLRAQLKSGNLVLGRLLVDLEFFPDAEPAVVGHSGKYLVLPTTRGTFSAIAENAGALVTELRHTVEMINQVLASDEVKSGISDLSATLANVKRFSAQLDETMAPQFDAVLAEAEATLREAREMLSTNSSTRTQINRVLVELGEAARSIRLLADYLEQHPESIIKGKD